MALKITASYFIAKCANIQSLQTCIENKKWACKDRVTSPIQPRVLLSDALENSQCVIIIFSVNNCHGYHGYVEMLSCPLLKADEETSKILENDGNDKLVEAIELSNNSSNVNKSNDEQWHYFDVKWITEYSSEFGEQCLPFQKTADLVCTDGTPLNKARNWQELDTITGEKLCALVDDHYKKLQCRKQEKLKRQEDKLPPPFLKPDCNVSTFVENWSQIVKKVETELGPVLLACPFGSQRYNLDTVQSDMDMFVVYQTSTQSLLYFGSQPPQTVKSSEREALDYTIHEVYRYGELLLAGDHRCVETLFLHESSYVSTTDTFKQLLSRRHLFLNSLCLEKYLRDALGNKGLKLLEKWTKDKQSSDPLSEREAKLAYIIIRLLQNAKNIVDGDNLQVYRDDNSQEKKLLMLLKTRENQPTVQFVFDEINSLKSYIDDNKVKVSGISEEIKLFMNQWIFDLRKKQLL